MPLLSPYTQGLPAQHCRMGDTCHTCPHHVRCLITFGLHHPCSGLSYVRPHTPTATTRPIHLHPLSPNPAHSCVPLGCFCVLFCLPLGSSLVLHTCKQMNRGTATVGSVSRWWWRQWWCWLPCDTSTTQHGPPHLQANQQWHRSGGEVLTW